MDTGPLLGTGPQGIGPKAHIASPPCSTLHWVWVHSLISLNSFLSLNVFVEFWKLIRWRRGGGGADACFKTVSQLLIPKVYADINKDVYFNPSLPHLPTCFLSPLFFYSFERPLMSRFIFSYISINAITCSLTGSDASLWQPRKTGLCVLIVS